MLVHERCAAGRAALPYGDKHLADFKQHFCYDRFWSDAGAAPNTRYLCSGLALIAVGDAQSDFCRCADRGVLAQFRHPHFLLFLIAHLQKATLLMYSDQLAEVLTAMDVTKPEGVTRFKRLIRMSYVGFLGMNLLAEADALLWQKFLMFFAVFVPIIGLTPYTMVKSKKLSDSLDVVSDERLSGWTKTKAFFGVWFTPRG
jgi:hypothetical protein